VLTFSAGVTAWSPGDSLEAALRRADDLMYRAKRAGKNRVEQEG
jgi:diguanylate cyclase